MPIERYRVKGELCMCLCCAVVFTLNIPLFSLRCHPQQPTCDTAGISLTMPVKWGTRSCLHFFLPCSSLRGCPIVKSRLTQPPLAVQWQQTLISMKFFLPQTTLALNMMRLYHTSMINTTTGSRLHSMASTSTSHIGRLYNVIYRIA